MASNKLFTLFDDKLRQKNELLSGPQQTLESLAPGEDSSETLLESIKQFHKTKFKVDYSDFSNFVFFNSSLDYFNISGEKILNEFNRDDTRDKKQQFLNDLDPYQNYLYEQWPKVQGHLKFNTSYGNAYVSVPDYGIQSGTDYFPVLNPLSSSFSVEFWCVSPQNLTGNSVMFVTQKITGSGGFSVYFSGSKINFSVFDGTYTDTVSASFSAGTKQFFCASYNKDSTTPILRLYSGNESSFPSLDSYLTGTTGAINCYSAPFYIGSGSLSGKTTAYLSCSLDDVRVWKKARSLVELSSSYNTKVHAQDKLLGAWSFNESSQLSSSDGGSTVFDHSGNKLHGVIQNYYSQIRVEDSLLPFDEDEPILSLSCEPVIQLIATQQLSASLYDRNNDNQLSRMLPEQFFLLEDFKQTSVLKNFLFVLGRYFDQLKSSIDQFAYVLKNDYGVVNQTPDALLYDVAQFFGWQFTGNFFDSSAVQYLIGKNVLPGTQANKEIDTKFYQIKNEFWKRTLINLIHIYKTKGTMESVDTLLKIYGVNKNFVRLKEFGYKKNAGIQTHRINSEKSVYVIAFASGSGLLTNKVVSPSFSSSVQTIETRVRFPTPTSSYLTSSLTTGSIWFTTAPSANRKVYFTKLLSTDTSGTIHYSGSEGTLSVAGANIFDNKWYNITLRRDSSKSTVELLVSGLERDEVTTYLTASSFVTLSTASLATTLTVGSSASVGSQMWAQEVRVWDKCLSDTEVEDHTLNYQSFGTDEVNDSTYLKLHWRLDENYSANGSGTITGSIVDYTGNGNVGSASGFQANINPFSKFLNDFNYIASPEYGWNEEKIRVLNSSVVPFEEAFSDQPTLALEFNLIDALNEDISQIFSTLDSFNEIIGSPANRYRDSYPNLDILRANYFRRLQGAVNFTTFIDLLEFFDRSFISMIKRLLPARSVFMGDEVVVESHMLERPKMQWTYRRRDANFEPEGVIKILIR